MNTTDHATLAALIAGVDQTARAHEQEWGLDRLPMLVSDDLRAKFFRQQAKWSDALNVAYETNDRPLTPPELTTLADLSAGLQRGWSAMGAQATESGHRALRPEIWEMRLSDGSKAALVRSVAEAGHVADQIAHGGSTYVAVWTLDEIVNVIAINLPTVIAEAKSVFPAAKLQVPDGPKWTPEGDAIPFGEESGEDPAEAFGKIDIAPKVVQPLDFDAEFS